MADNNRLCYSSEVLEAILDDFILLLSEEEFVDHLKTSGQSEFETVSRLIEDKQNAIFEKYGIDPKRGFQDMPKIKRVYPKDHVIARKMMFLALREESVTNYAIISPNNPHYKIAVPPTMKEFEQRNMAQFPAMMAALQEQLKKNPGAVEQMNPQQKAMLAQMIKTQQTLAAQGIVAPSPAVQEQPSQHQDNGKGLDFTKPSTKDMNNEGRADDPFAQK